MTWHKPFGDIEVEYIEHHYPQMGCAEIAEKLGRSEQGVRNVVNRLGLAQRRARVAGGADGAGPPEPSLDDGAQDELAELREIKRELKRSMKQDAGPQTLPKLSAELREVLRRISEIEEGGDDGSGGSLAGGAGNITVTVPLRPA